MRRELVEGVDQQTLEPSLEGARIVSTQRDRVTSNLFVGGNFFVRWAAWSVIFALICALLEVAIHRGAASLTWGSIVPSALIYGAFLAALAQKQFIKTAIPTKWLYAAFIGFAILVTISMALLNDPVLSPTISTGAWAIAVVLCLMVHRRGPEEP